MASQQKDICVIIPVYNEGRMIGQICRALRNKGLDVVVIDDGSTDNCGDQAKQAGAVVLRNPMKSGKGTSLKKGFTYTLEHGYKGAITMDGDGQHDVEDIDRFLEALKTQNADIISGNRMSDTKGMPLIRKLTNIFMSFIISLACGQKIPDTQCGFRYISSRFLKSVPLMSSDFEIETEIILKARKNKFLISSVPVKTIYQNEESKIHPLKDTVRFISYFTREIFSK